MTGNQVLAYVDAVMENTVKPAIKLRWLNQIEMEIQVRILQKPLEALIRYKAEDLNEQMIAPRPYDGLYSEYLFWRICQMRQETQLAENYKQSFERMFFEYVRHICETE